MTETNLTNTNVDAAEISRFDAVASRWWDPAGEFAPLHRINPLRLKYVADLIPLEGLDALDIGCGGGLFSEALAASGANVTGLDMAPGALNVARLHLAESGLDVEYVQTTAEDYATKHENQFDVVTCLEMLEHVPAPEQVVAAAAAMVKPGGTVVFSTINRTPKAFALAIVGAEYVLNWVPRGTHEFQKFIKPAELDRAARQCGLQLQSFAGLEYDPLADKFSISDNVDVNYFAHYQRADDA
ncbi:MAG: bifunctional 2-polyprenyl-6-hydroxyphenol methylase/3-demethylubiquinol 3-O-methyltransferase UbiG [Woeseiaceae bacterium]